MEPELTPEQRDAVHAQRNAAQAVETARAVQMAAISENTTQALAEALREVFGEYTEQQRFIDTKRIPLICKQIDSIHDALQEIKDNMVNQDQFWPVRTIVYGLVGIMLTGMVGAIVLLVVK